MIKASGLRNMGTCYVSEEVTYQKIIGMIRYFNEEIYGLPIKAYIDRLKSGGLINSSVEDCLILENVNHPKDYLKYCLTIRRQGKLNIITVSRYGLSGNALMANQTEEMRESGTFAGMVINAVSGVNEAAYQKECNYYRLVEEMLTRIIH